MSVYLSLFKTRYEPIISISFHNKKHIDLPRRERILGHLAPIVHGACISIMRGPKCVRKIFRCSKISLPRGGVHDLWIDGGLPPGFQKGTLF